jgi:hypothetical protein
MTVTPHNPPRIRFQIAHRHPLSCIELFEAIDPKVSMIRTIVGDRQDTIYFLTAIGWEAR